LGKGEGVVGWGGGMVKQMKNYIALGKPSIGSLAIIRIKISITTNLSF
jgi:hypothetical protein